MAAVFYCVPPDPKHLVIVKTSTDTRAKWFFSQLLQLRPLATLKHARVQLRAADFWINNDPGLFLARHFLAVEVSAAEPERVRVTWTQISPFKSNSRIGRQSRSWKTLRREETPTESKV